MSRQTAALPDQAAFLTTMGVGFIQDLKNNAEEPDAPQAIRDDWSRLAKFVGFEGGTLTRPQADKLEKAWSAYLGIGLAPSFRLQGTFDSLRRQVSNEERPPSRVMDVFDRLLASRDEIAAKKATDWAHEEERWRLIREGGNNASLQERRTQVGWWRRQPPIARTWLFASAVWIVTMGLYLYFFDPLEIGDWAYTSGNEITQIGLILLWPLGAGAVFYAYRRWVR